MAVPLDFTDLDLAMQQQKRIMNVSHALASDASIMSKQFPGQLIPTPMDTCKNTYTLHIHSVARQTGIKAFSYCSMER